jgi:nitrate/TMAO reductase-like tetraheme cytochrome c subunit
LPFSLPALADNYSLPKNVAFEEECTSCHIAYPPQMLDAHSWQHMMNDLATTSAPTPRSTTSAVPPSPTFWRRIPAAARPAARSTPGKPLLRITETARFEKKHREIAAATWKRASIKSPANCTACHRQAAAGDYSERSINIPK